MEKAVTVTQRNFKHLREQYGVKLKDIADVCNLSQQTVNSFEKCKGEYTQINARSYNGDMMLAALQNLINEKLKKHTEGSEDTRVGKGRYNKVTDISRRMFVERLENYLNTEHITLKEFCKMCDLTTPQFQDWYIEKNPMLSKKALRLITAATGWTYDDIKSGEFAATKINTKGEPTMSYIGTQKSSEALKLVVPEPEMKALMQRVTTTDDRQNVRYVARDGKFYRQYDILKHVSEEIDKDTFFEAVSNM